jgi:hypothetical protein
LVGGKNTILKTGKKWRENKKKREVKNLPLKILVKKPFTKKILSDV